MNDEEADIFRVEMPLRVMPSEVIIVRGRLLNKETNEPIEAKIIYEKLPDGTIAGITKSQAGTGIYEIVLPKGQRYGYRAEAEGYLTVNENIDLTVGDDIPDEINQDMYLMPMVTQATITLNNIFFDFDKSSLKQGSSAELNRLVTFLTESPAVRIKIVGHTDSVGAVEYNMRLSQRRAKSVTQYLTSKGIAANRIDTAWYGEMKPIANNETDEGRSKNRRVEMTILEK